MSTVHVDSTISDTQRRAHLYQGDLFVYGPKPSTFKLIEHARSLIESAFGAINPRLAQYHIPVEKFVEICAPMKPAFIHHPETKKILQQIIADFGCDPETTYIDVPRLRMVTSHGYLTSGIGYAHHPHRDTWYSAPASQINWWLPIYEIEGESSMAFHPRYWNKPIRNTSNEFNYYRWNSSGRKDAAKHITSDTRKQPKAEEPLTLEPEIRFVPAPGGAILFSAAQLHSTVPNTTGQTRYSIDFRTVDINDVRAKAGAAIEDSHCTGTSLRDFMRGTDLTRIDENTAKLYDREEAPEEFRVFRPEIASA